MSSCLTSVSDEGLQMILRCKDTTNFAHTQTFGHFFEKKRFIAFIRVLDCYWELAHG